jgi:hypothetical protein
VATKVVNIRHAEFDIYIGRAGKGQDGSFGNPVAMGKKCPECGETHTTGASTLPCYTLFFYRQMQNDPQFKAKVESLKDKTLGCFCVPKGGANPKSMVCHGQVIAWYLDNNKEI